jgi:hypothetical protein
MRNLPLRLAEPHRINFVRIPRPDKTRGENKMCKETRKPRTQSLFKIWFAAVVLLMAASMAAYAQEPAPTQCPGCEPPMLIQVSGTVRNCAGAPLTGVVVNLEGDNGTSVNVTTNASGVYSIFLQKAEYIATPFDSTGYFYAPQSSTNNPASFTRYPRDNRANFDGDCRTDVSTYNRGSGEWRTRNSSNGQVVSFFFGQSADIATPGDYNADGRTDRAVFRPGNGTWYIATDTSGAFYGVQFGTSGDIPVPRDYDGDNKTDIAVFRPGEANWYILNSSLNSLTVVHFGETGDRVVPGDYDGDGRANIAVFHPGPTGVWKIRRDDGTTDEFQFGVTSDWPVQADYNGDGITDVAVWRPSDGFWYFRRPDGTFYGFPFGLTGDRPVPGDYDGDGSADVAVQRPDSNGTWHLLNSTAGYTAVNFPPAEFPVPGGYLTPLY